ncbi:MAG: hypothetical protein Q8M09_12500 [Pseudomonadota bacterium]|nr:hypothetical protein [Pseudomonadota bacterium]MDP1905047.1 hypothetical protein [Pseudomonadota bacterium]MDP2354288.1 hypothetical protein [Pseudomonadota bacterium]
MSGDWIERVLDDWGWWARQRERAGYRCRSAEGHYRRERVGEADDAPRAVDEVMCLAVERVVCQPGFPARARGVLKGWYVLRVSLRQIARLGGFPACEFEAELHRAQRMVKNLLDNASRATNILTNNPTSADLVSSPCPMAGARTGGKITARQA